MQNKVQKKGIRKTGKVVSKSVQSRDIGQGEKKTVNDARVEVEFGHIVRVKPCDFEAIKNSFEEWAVQWE